MQKRLFNGTTLPGYGSLILAVLPFFEKGGTMTLTTGALVAIGTILVLYGVIKKPPNKPPTRTEANALYKSRSKYLLPLKRLVADYINRVEFLAQSTPKLYDLKLLRKTYMSNYIWKRESLKSFEDKISLLALLRYRIYVDNIVFAQVQDEDTELFRVNQLIDSHVTDVKDKKIRNYIKGFRLGAHMAYSNFIFNKLVTMHFENTWFVIRVYLNLKRRMQDRFRQHQSDFKLRIDELLEGAPDEL